MQLSDRNLGRLLRMQLPELVYRGKQETFKFVDRVRTARSAPVTRAERNGQRLRRFLEHCQTYFFQGVFDPKLTSVLETTHGDECQAVLIAAHHAFHGRFDLLGYKGLEFGDPIDWHLDAVSGRRAPFVHWSRLNPLDCEAVGDSKVTWELNRHQWLVQLGQAWRLTNDERYAHAVVHSIRSWLLQNPTGIGINWSSSLELAFRLIAWSWALLLIYDSNALTADVFCDIENAVEAHATHIERYLSYYFSPNTHLTGEALGLFYAGVVFPDLKNAARLRDLGARILLQEIERQILADGIYFERTTCYQRYTADIYLHFAILAKRLGMELPNIFYDRLKSAIHALIAMRRPSGEVPSIGDEDNGTLLPLSAARSDDYRATFSTAAVVFSDPVFAWAADSVATDTLWMLGGAASNAFDRIEKRPPETTAQVFAIGGFVAMRSGWEAGAHALLFDAGPLGCHYSAGHGHADLLSIQCSAFGEPFLVDAGTCCYTADRELRDFFRSSAAHSTVTLDGLSQADPAGTFSWKNRCEAQLLRWQLDPSLTYADALNGAYRRLTDRVTHRRRVAFVGSRYWIIVDELCGSEKHRVDLRFQFAPMEIQTGDDDWTCATRDGRRGLLLRAFATAPLRRSVRKGLRNPREGWISPAYGRMEPAPALVYSADAKLPVRIVTLLCPAANIEKLPDVELLHDASGLPNGIRNGEDIVTFDDDEMYVRNRRNP